MSLGFGRPSVQPAWRDGAEVVMQLRGLLAPGMYSVAACYMGKWRGLDVDIEIWRYTNIDIDI